MKLHYLKSLSALALAGMFAFNASAETVSDEFVVSFSNYEIGTQFNTFWGNPNPGIAIVANPLVEGDGNVLLVNGFDKDAETDEPQINEGGGKVWNTLARIPSLALPKGYNLSHVVMIEVTYMPTQEDGVSFGIQLRNPDSDYLLAEGDIIPNEWNTVVFDPQDFTTPTSEENPIGEPLNSKAGSFDFCFGIKGSTDYYVRDIKFYLEKEMTQRELDEAALNKETAACVALDFSDMPEGPSDHIGSNGGSINREDMVFDKGPEGYDNMCAHIIYGGWTNIFLWGMTAAPEGYTFDDLRLVEYDIYQTSEKGVDCTNGAEFEGAITPQLKVKQAPWQIESQSSSCGNTPLENNKWTHVEFYPSQLAWASRDIQKPVLDAEGNQVLDDEGNPKTETVTQSAEEVCAEFGKLTEFSISIGGMPCLNQVYVDNVKLWFQKAGDTAVENIASDVVESDTVTVYNLQGIRVLKGAEKAAVNNLPAGLYIVNGKKVIVK